MMLAKMEWNLWNQSWGKFECDKMIQILYTDRLIWGMSYNKLSLVYQRLTWCHCRRWHCIEMLEPEFYTKAQQIIWWEARSERAQKSKQSVRQYPDIDPVYILCSPDKNSIIWCDNKSKNHPFLCDKRLSIRSGSCFWYKQNKFENKVQYIMRLTIALHVKILSIVLKTQTESRIVIHKTTQHKMTCSFTCVSIHTLSWAIEV
jgi:hypothetical protein